MTVTDDINTEPRRIAPATISISPITSRFTQPNVQVNRYTNVAPEVMRRGGRSCQTASNITDSAREVMLDRYGRRVPVSDPGLD